MYAATSGLAAHQAMLDVTANNLANVDTVGYKRQRTQFSDELSEQVAAGGPANGYSAGTNPVQIGLGVQVGSIDNVMSQGGVLSTGNATDVAVEGDGFLRVANGDVSVSPPAFDPTEYTGSTAVTIGADGNVSYVTAAGVAATAGYISLATFPNQAGLERTGGSLWSATLPSGSEIVAQPGSGTYGQTISGRLEQSNVDMGAEFINVIEAERGYQANAGTITTADRMLQAAVRMKR